VEEMFGEEGPAGGEQALYTSHSRAHTAVSCMQPALQVGLGPTIPHTASNDAKSPFQNAHRYEHSRLDTVRTPGHVTIVPRFTLLGELLPGCCLIS